jgi:hypothetical protein
LPLPELSIIAIVFVAVVVAPAHAVKEPPDETSSWFAVRRTVAWSSFAVAVTVATFVPASYVHVTAA